jgi:hypothetical protein
MFERSRRAYNDDMSGTAMVAIHVGTMAGRDRSLDRSVVVRLRAKFSRSGRGSAGTALTLPGSE